MAKLFNEYGRLGQQRFGSGPGSGVFHEEFLRQLQGRRGVEVYKEMSENDDVIGAALFAVEMLMRQVSWDVKEGGTSKADREAAEFVLSCMYDMDETWTDFISEVLSFLTFGWSFHEIVYKRRLGTHTNPAHRSKYDDGLIGWRKLPIRSQDTLWEWRYDDADNLLGLVQCAPPFFDPVLIPIEKALHFKTRSRKANPEGRSLLRNAYLSWYFKRRIQEIEGIGIERDLAGLPVLQPPEGLNLWDQNDAEMTGLLAMSERIVSNVRRDEREGIVLPFGWTFELASTGGKRQFDTNAVIQRYNNGIAMTMMSDFLFLGHEQVGSFALSSDKTELFGVALGTYLDLICEVVNSQGIPRLLAVNGDVFKGITAYPELIHGDIETPDLAKLGGFVKDMVGVGAITPDGGMEDYLRMAADLPEIDDEAAYMGGRSNGYKPKPKSPDGQEQDEPPTTGE